MAILGNRGTCLNHWAARAGADEEISDGRERKNPVTRPACNIDMGLRTRNHAVRHLQWVIDVHPRWQPAGCICGGPRFKHVLCICPVTGLIQGRSRSDKLLMSFLRKAFGRNYALFASSAAHP